MDYKHKRKVALQEFVKKIRERSGSEIVSIILYGSEAKEGQKETSDIDVFIVVRNYSVPLRRSIMQEAVEIYDKYEIDISPAIYGQEQVNSERFKITPFYKNILKEGVPL